MADLIQIDTDEEMDKYAEAELISRNPPPVAAIKKKTLNYNPTTGRNDVLTPLSTGGYVKIGDEELPRTEKVQQYARELENIGVPFDMADYEAAGFSAEEVQAAGVMPVEQEKTGRTEPLREGEELRLRREGEAIAAPYDPTLRQNTTDTLREIFVAAGLDDFQARQIAEGLIGNPNATRDLGIGVADFTPAGLFFGAQEGYRTFERGINTGDAATIGMGALEAGLSLLEAVPLTAAGAKAAKAGIPTLRNALTEVGKRLNQPGDMPTTSAFGVGAIDDAKPSAAELRRQANIQRFGYDPNEAPDTSYRMEHQPRGPEDGEGIRLDDLTKNISGEQAGYPDDFYTPRGADIYARGPSFPDDEYGMANQESYKIITSVRNNPDAEVTIYRAVPDEDAITTINPGDFVTLSRTYAEVHGASGYGRSGDEPGKILEQKVKVRDIYWDGNDVNEFGYFPEEQ
jgi:hypothetical protein